MQSLNLEMWCSTRINNISNCLWFKLNQINKVYQVISMDSRELKEIPRDFRGFWELKGFQRTSMNSEGFQGFIVF